MTLDPLTIWKTERAFVPPRALPNVIAPAPAVSVRLRAVRSLLTVPESVKAPPPELSEMLLPSVIFEAACKVPAVEMFALRLKAGVPVCVWMKDWLEVTVFEIVRVPPFKMAMLPLPPVVVIVPLNEAAPVVVTEIGPATPINPVAVKEAALDTVNAVGRVARPIPDMLTVPVPAARTSGKAPFTAPESVILPAPDPVFKDVAAINSICVAKLIFWFVVEIVAPEETVPVPV